MTIRGDITINWAASPRIIEVPAPSLTVQDLYDTLRDKAASSEAMDDTEIIDGSGKENLGEGVLVGLTVKLLDAKVKFEAQASPTICVVSGGNLIAVDVSGGSTPPIEPSTNVTVILAQSTSASLIEGSGTDPQVIADAVWDETVAGHTMPDTFGAKGQKMVPSEDIEDYRVDISALATESGGRLESIENFISFVYNIEGGRWKIENNQMVFYKADNVTEIARFNLFNAQGLPAMAEVVERQRV